MTDVKSALVNHVLSSCKNVTKVTVCDFFFDGDPEGYSVAVSVDFVDPEADQNEDTLEQLIFGLPVSTPHVFVTVTDGDPARMSRIIANLEQHERSGAILSTNSFIALDGDDFLERHGRVGAIFLPLTDSYFLESVPPALITSAGERHFLYVVLLNSLESELLHSQGFDALFDAWFAAGRGITAIDDGLGSL